MTFTPMKVGEPANQLLRLNYLFNKAYQETANPTQIRFARMWHHDCIKVAGAGIMASASSGSGSGQFPYHDFWTIGPAVNSNLNDEFENYFTLDAGTYDLVILACTQGNSGIVDWRVDGVSLGTTDLYSASEVMHAQLIISSVTIATSGKHTLTMKVTGKNASAGDYIVRLYKYAFREAA